MRVLICGGRTFGEDHADRVYFSRFMADLDNSFGLSLVIEGGARGADAMARDWGLKRKIPVMEFPAAWTSMKERAGPARNGWMLMFGQPQVVVAFPGGRGTANMVSQALKKAVRVIDLRERPSQRVW